MNIRVLDKNDKAALEQLIYTIENALPVPEWWIPIDFMFYLNISDRQRSALFYKKGEL